MKINQKRLRVATETISNIFKWICCHWKKSFLINAPNGYLKRALRYANQNLDQPSAFTEILHHLHLVTASTEIAATGVNGIVLQTGFHHPVK